MSKVFGYGASVDDLSYLEPNSRAIIWSAQLASGFKVSGRSGTTAETHDALVELRDAPTSLSLRRPSIAFLKQQMALVRSYADLRDDRLMEITEQTDDLLSFFGSVFHLDTGRRRKTLEFLNVLQGLVIDLELLVKHHCLRPRPADLAAQVQPMIQTPDHSSYPSGHAAEAFAIATALHYLSQPGAPAASRAALSGISDTAMPFRLAARIASNRTVAGVHYPVDSLVGAQLGCFISHAVLVLSGADLGAGEEAPALVTALDDPDGAHGANADGMAASDDFLLSKLKDPSAVTAGFAALPSIEAPDTLLANLFDKVTAEWSVGGWDDA